MTDMRVAIIAIPTNEQPEHRYTDIDGDKLMITTAAIPDVGPGVYFRTDGRGSSVPLADIPALIEQLQVIAAAAAKGEELPRLARPTVTVLCGSTRFYDAFQQANYELTMAGHIVLSVGFYPHNPQVHGEGVGCTPAQKDELDELHKRKIDLADEVLVLNVGGYIGSSTRSEIDYAHRLARPVRYLEPLTDTQSAQEA